MRLLMRIWSFARNLTRRRVAERDLDDEVRAHLDLLTDEKIREGLDAADARREARIELGGVEQVKEEVRGARAGAFLEELAQDLRFGARMLRKSPGFTAAAALTLALGLGANVAIFTVLNGVVLKPLPYRDPGRLTLIWTEWRGSSHARLPASGPQVQYLRERSSLFEDIAGIWVGNGAITGQGEPEQVKVGFVTPNFLSILGVPPQLGRVFLPSEQGPSAGRVMVLSDALWRRRFGADPSVVGRSIRFEDASAIIIGVMPQDFEVVFPSDASVPPDMQAWVPFPYELAQLPRDLNFVRVMGRLRPGVTLAQAQAESSGIAGQLRAEFAEFSKQNIEHRVVSLREDAARDIRPTLVALFGAVAMIVLIACANVANLLLARGNRRRREITLRFSLGATRSRIVRQLLTESVLLSVLGGIAGLLLGWWGLQALLALRPANIARVRSVHLDLASLGYAFAVTLMVGVLFGLAPAFASRRIRATEAIQEGGRTATSGRQFSQRLLIVGEVALGLVLLIGAALMTRTFAKLVNVDPGFHADGVITFQIALPGARYKTDVEAKTFFRELEKKISALPGAVSVGAASHLPFDDFPNWYEYYWREGASAQEETSVMADHRTILPGFLESMGATMLAGRTFTDTDDPTHPNVIVVDDTLARRTWPNESALGKKLNVGFIHNGSFDRAWAEVVGVVKHVRYSSLMAEGRGQVYVPYFQSAREQLAFTVRTQGDPRALLASIRQQLDTLDKDLPLSKVRPLEAYLTQARAATRFATIVAASLAALALLLTALGVYAVTAYAVSRRTREVGIRMALGAQRGAILKLVLRQGMLPVLFGVGIGLLLGFGLMPLLAGLLFGVGPADLPTFGVTSAFLMAVGLAACYVPARRAMRVDPIVALRYE